ncbi:MAG: helix-turn-helix domain-containing protein [Clostridiales bacterium]|nr:helix-turn-helix domain-containing protein [Clostridiales bacterium]
MKISYKKLWVLLAEREISKLEFREALQLASGTMTKLNKGQERIMP